MKTSRGLRMSSLLMFFGMQQLVAAVFKVIIKIYFYFEKSGRKLLSLVKSLASDKVFHILM
jgi:hypothetical protein